MNDCLKKQIGGKNKQMSCLSISHEVVPSHEECLAKIIPEVVFEGEISIADKQSEQVHSIHSIEADIVLRLVSNKRSNGSFSASPRQ